MFEELLSNPMSVILVMSGATTGLVEIVKKAELIDKKYLPLTALIAGIFISWCVSSFVFDSSVIILGIVFGLTSSGFFDNFEKLIDLISKK
ncbi:MAG: hypothetical protein KAS32_11930 [Candidatus Peribacteraceae bacterium]|nr:hypothetical protein [Candidatus Peribacteraceae bacterium]